jgi:DNA-binding CsgD family transcriptional regulator
MGGLVERELESGLLAKALAAAITGAGSLTVIRGGLGIGKSVLARAVPDLANAGVRILTASAAPTEQDFPFGVVEQLLGPASGGGGEGLRSLFDRVGAERPVAVVVDDLHWADRQSLEWLCSLAGSLRGRPIALVVTVRDGDPGALRPPARELCGAATAVLHPEPLSDQAIRALVRARFPAAPSAFIRACSDASGGNPLFLDAILGELAAGSSQPSAVIVAETVPWALRERLAAAVDALPKAVLGCAQAIAILGEHAVPELVAQLAAADEVAVADARRTLRRLGLLTPEVPFGFVAPVVLDVVEESMTVADRKAAHQNAAAVLHRSGSPAEEAVRHLLAVPTHQNPPWMIEELRTAADEAVVRGEPESAARYLRRALLACAPSGTERARLLVDLATAEERFDITASVRHVQQAVQLLPSPREQAEAIVRLSLTTASSTGIRAIGALTAGAFGTAGHSGGFDAMDRRLEARARIATLGDPVALGGSVDRLRELGIETRLSSTDDRELLAVLGYAAMVTADFPAAEVAVLANRLLRCEPTARTYEHHMVPLVVSALVNADASADALPWLDSALTAAGQAATAAERALLLSQRASVAMQLGDVELAGSTARELDGIGVAAQPVLDVSDTVLCAVAMTLRDPAMARLLLARHDGLALDKASPHLRSALLMLRGSMLAADDPEAALECFLDCGATLADAGWRNPSAFPWRPWAAVLRFRLGYLDAAAETADDDWREAGRWGAPGPIGRALRVKALLGGPHAGDLLAESVTTLRKSGDRLELTKALLAHAAWLRSEDGTGGGALERLREAYAVAGACGAGWLVDQVREQPGWSDPVFVRGRSLSEAEQRVVELALSGLKNGEIAVELGVTRRAVEKHLTGSYRKLGITGRVELAGAVAEMANVASGQPG